MSGYLGRQPRTAQCGGIKLALFSLVTLLLLIMPLPLFKEQVQLLICSSDIFFLWLQFQIVSFSAEDCTYINQKENCYSIMMVFYVEKPFLS